MAVIEIKHPIHKYCSMNVIGYFKHLGFKWMLIEKEGTMLKGFDITPLGKVHTLHISESEVQELTLIQ